MPAYSSSIEIAAPPEAVWVPVADLTRHGEWSADPLQLEAVEEDHVRSTTTAKGKTITAELTVLERDPPHRFVFEATDLTGRWRHTFTLAPRDGGTLLRREIAGSLSGAQLLLYWVVVLLIKEPNAARALRRLKELLEQPG